jgi:hypothetical protein
MLRRYDYVCPTTNKTVSYYPEIAAGSPERCPAGAIDLKEYVDPEISN